MAFFKKWKNSAKHSKLSEEWSLATSMKDFAVHSDDIDTDSEEPETFEVKYLGCTLIDAVRSEEATAEAVKSVILTAKSSRKKLARVNLCVSPRGIEMFDAHTGDTLLQVSIYKISYCSADAAHSDVFAFVGTECGPGIDPLDEQLTCYAFLCGKRKIAQKVTLTVAHSFEQAYQIWQEASTRKQYQLERRAARKQQLESAAKATAAAAATTVTSDAASQQAAVRATVYRTGSSHSCSDDDPQDLLIDFNGAAGEQHCSSSGGELTDDLFDKERHRTVLQNTWVSFDDDDGNDTTDEADGHQHHHHHHHHLRHSPAASVWDTTLKSNV